LAPPPALEFSAAVPSSIVVLPVLALLAVISSALPALPDSSREARVPSIPPAPRPVDILPALLARVPVSVHVPASALLVPVVLVDLAPARAELRHRKQAVRSVLLRVAVAVASSSTPRPRKAR